MSNVNYDGLVLTTTNRVILLEQMNDLYRIITENSQDILTYIKPDGCCLYVSPSVTALLGYEQHELIGKTWIDLYHPDDFEYLMQLKKNVDNIDEEVFVGRVRHIKGHFIWFETTFKSIRNSNGEITAIIGTGRNIEKRKQVEDALKQSEERFRSAFENASIGMALVDLDGYWVRVNKALCEILGYTEAELLEMTYLDITYPDDLNIGLDHIQKLVDGHLSFFMFEKRYIHKQGHIVWAKLTSSLIRNEAGNPVYFIVHIQDITEKMLLSEVRKEKETLLNITDNLSAIGQIVGSIAHEIRNPLTTVRGFIQLLNERTGRMCSEYCDLIIDELDRANEIITNFLTLSQKRVILKKQDSLNRIIKIMHPLLEADANMKGQQILLHLQKDISEVCLDEREIKQLLLNLTRNSMEAMTKGGVMTISTVEKEEAVELIIADTGFGIIKEKLCTLFEPFYTTKEDGTGLGLPVCLSIVEKHGGNIRVQSEEGEGTAFIISFPKVIMQDGISLEEPVSK
ncbi:MAG: kinE 4 [Paenibacillus sp.]|nr:kinE 4 [Paenibacillus sp.]